MDEYDDEVLQIFVTECREHLDTIETDLLAIEERGADIDEALVNKVFRAAHSIKGGSGFFGLNKVKELAHKAETVLDMIRSRKMEPNAEVINILLAAFDKLRVMVNATGESEQTDIADLVSSLVGLASSYLPADKKESLTTRVPLLDASGAEQAILPQSDLDRIARTGQNVYWMDCDLIHDVEHKGLNIMGLFGALSSAGEILDCALDYTAVGTLDDPVGNRLPLRLVVASALDSPELGGLFGGLETGRIHKLAFPAAASAPPAAPAQPVPQPAASAPAGAASAGPATSSPVPARAAPVAVSAPAAGCADEAESPQSAVPSSEGADDTLRVNVKLLESLMDLASELVLSRNQLRAAVAADNRQSLAAVDQRINQITTELQDVIMRTRLQPIGNVFSKFPRVVRDLSRTLGKDIRLDIEGKDIALDKTIIEGLSDPLTHMVRNSVDHGIETVAERLSAGKPAAGVVRIEARHEAGLVVVEIRDDGKGIDPKRIADAAVRKGLISAERANALSDRDKQELIFLPGLSTADKVSDVSGRGVGMDVVKTNLDRLGGQVEIESAVGKGSTFRIKLPLTLAIIPSLIVSVGNERFALPQTNIEELLRLRPEDVKNRVVIVGDSEVLLLRDRMLPLARFEDILGIIPSYFDPDTGSREIDRRGNLADRRSVRYGIEGAESAAPDAPRQRSGTERRRAAASVLEIAVVTTGSLSFGLVVGSFHDTEEIVVKPLGRRLKGLREYSGATILGDGAVALILDMAGLAEKAGLGAVPDSARAARETVGDQRKRDTHTLMLFNSGPELPCAIPLDLVRRIERISPGRIERLGSFRTMQYRGGSLPLIALSDTAAFASVEDADDPVVLVCGLNGREVGLLGTMPVDIVSAETEIDRDSHRRTGIAGAAIVDGKTTLVVDLHELADAARPEWATPRAMRAEGAAPAPLVLLAEDSDFFRSQVKKFLEDAGLAVLEASDGEAAWELLEDNLGKVRVLVTDIEMPRLSGLGLTSRVRADKRTAALPVIAVTSLAGEEDEAQGKAAGVTEYQVKLDRDKLLESVMKYISVKGEIA